MRRTLLAVATAVALLSGAGAASASDTPSPSASGSPSGPTQLERVNAYTQPSVVYIQTDWTGYVYDTYNKRFLNNQKPFTLSFQCTGYVVNPNGYIATAGHCVDPDQVKPDFYAAAAQWAVDNGYYAADTLTVEDILGFGDYVVMNAQKKRRPDLKVTAAWGVSAGGVETGKALPARVVKFQPFDQGDGAIIKVEQENLNALPLTDDDIEIGTEVVAIGYPASVDVVADQTFTPSYKEGSISAEKTMSGGLLKVYEISAATSGGMSGGPAVNLDGEILGFVSFKPSDESQPFNFIRPSETISELLGDAGADNELSEDSQNYRAGLDAFFAGNRTTAVSKLQSVVDDQPTNDLAKQYLEKAKKLPVPKKEDSGGGSGLIIGIVIGLIVLALLAGLLFFLLSRSRKNKKGSAASGPAPAYVGAGVPAGPGGYQGAPSGYQGQPSGYQGQPGPYQGQPSGPPSAPPPAPPAAPVSRPTAPPPPAPSAPAPAAQAPSAPPTPPAPSTEPVGTGASAATTEVTSPASSDDSGDLFCPNCGKQHAPGQKFCPHCGHAL